MISDTDKMAALETLNDNELLILGIDERPVWVSWRLKAFERLVKGSQFPKTPDQEHFKSVGLLEIPPTTPYEEAYLKYKSALVRILNEQFLDLDVEPSQEDYIRLDRKHYRNHCWNCKETVDSDHELGHRKCHWLICSNCGACGCGYDGN